MNRRRRHRILVLVALVSATVAAVTFLIAGQVVPGLLATAAGLATVAVAGRMARPTRWTPEESPDESR